LRGYAKRSHMVCTLPTVGRPLLGARLACGATHVTMVPGASGSAAKTKFFTMTKQGWNAGKISDFAFSTLSPTLCRWLAGRRRGYFPGSRGQPWMETGNPRCRVEPPSQIGSANPNRELAIPHGSQAASERFVTACTRQSGAGAPCASRSDGVARAPRGNNAARRLAKN
jgi:hypothetical protein